MQSLDSIIWSQISCSRLIFSWTGTSILWFANQHFVNQSHYNEMISPRFWWLFTPYRQGKHTPKEKNWFAIIIIIFLEKTKPAFCGAVKNRIPCSATLFTTLNFKMNPKNPRENFLLSSSLVIHYYISHLDKSWGCSIRTNFTSILWCEGGSLKFSTSCSIYKRRYYNEYDLAKFCSFEKWHTIFETARGPIENCPGR